MILESSGYMELDLLEKNQIFGKNRLSIFDEYNTRADITDFAILLGGAVNSDSTEKDSFKDREGYWFTKTPDGYGRNTIINLFGKVCIRPELNYSMRDCGIRPTIPYHLIPSNIIKKYNVYNEVEKIIFGEYPQVIVGKYSFQKLEEAYSNGNLRNTGKKYTTDSAKNYDKDFAPRTFLEYEYNGFKFIRFVDDYNCGEILSDGSIVKENNIYWIQVLPITWLVDEEKDIAITEKIIVAGIQFNNKNCYYGDFKNTNIYKYMNTYLVKDMFDNIEYKTIRNEVEHKEFESINTKIKTLRKRIDNIRK